ncbi:MAG: protein kinase domain-containing protein [Chloroflexia bacterium]
MARTQPPGVGIPQVCPNCGHSVVPDDGYCPDCGSPMELPSSAEPSPTATTAATTACPVCGTALRTGAEFCPNCGASVADATRSAGLEAAPTASAASDIAGGSSGPAPAACPKCGAPQRSNARFCKECGYRFKDIATSLPTGAGPAAALSVGKTLAGRYKIVGVIGGGGMGAVYKAVDTHLKTREVPEGRPAAVKAILNTDDPELLAAAVEEREMLIRLDNPNIVRIYDIVEEGGIPFIVMAFVQGTSWKQMYDANGGPLSEAEALRLVLGIRGAFEYLHHRTPPVVYRDFKPGNVIQVAEPNGNTRQVLIDLGTAVEWIPGQKREAWGTEGYAPPEIGGICEQTPAMDLFTIVSTLAALLGVDVAEQRITAPPRRSWPVSDEIYNLVVRGRDPDPSVRYQTVEELFDQLEGINRFILGQERARLDGTPQLTGRTTNNLPQSLIPVQSTLFTGKLLSSSTGKITALPSLSASDPATPALQSARDLMAAGRYDEALIQIDAALKTNPVSIDGHLLRAASLTNLGNIAAAQEELDRAQRLSTPATRWRTVLVQAQAAEAAHDYGRAEGLYGELIKLVPGEILPKQALADIYRVTERYAPAADLYHRVVAADPANADAVLGWADSLVALGQLGDAIKVLNDVNENALRYVDAQLSLIELYIMRIDAYLTTQKSALSAGKPPPPGMADLLHDLGLAARAIAGLNDRTESRRYYRLLADWWYAAYRLARARRLPPNLTWPDNQPHPADSPAAIGAACREAYKRYLRRAPDSPDKEDILARIYFDVAEWQ